MNGFESGIAKMVKGIIEDSGDMIEDIVDDMENMSDIRSQVCDLIEEMANDEVENESEESGHECGDEEESFIFNAIKTEIKNNRGVINATIRRSIGRVGKRKWEQES